MKKAEDQQLVHFIVLTAICLTWTLGLNWLMVTEEWDAAFAVACLGPALILVYSLTFDPDLFLYSIIFFVPLSVRGDMPGGFTISLPAEAMIVIMVLYALAYPGKFKPPDRRIFSHPIFLILVTQICWMLVTSLLSTSQMASFKRTIIQALYMTVFFFLFFTRFTSPSAILKFYAFYALGLVIPVINGFIWHSQYNFSQPSSYYMPQPFFIEHTLYGAVLAFIIPALFYLAFIFKEPRHHGMARPLFVFLLILCLAACFLAYSRAAWISLLSIPFLLFIFKYRIRIPYLIGGAAVAGVLLLLNTGSLVDYLRQNEARSNRDNLQEQIASVSNIQSDISNLERINRWRCALRMFRERPLTGFGPGTYQFEYGVFQVSSEMTRISTYHGEKGNAHSEYLGALAETGIPGMLIYLAIILSALHFSFKIIYRTRDPSIRGLMITIALCLIPFFLHTVVNAFLENDEIGSLYYGSLAAIAAIDLHLFRNEKPVIE